MTRRTTLSADADDLALLEAEAARRGVSLARVLREIVAREANELRNARRPRFGVVSIPVAAAQASVDDEDATHRKPFRS